MIIYATKQTFERYKLKLPKELTHPINQIAETVIENESGDKILEWGAKLFYFDKRKCIQVVNFASKLTLFLVDVKVADLENVGDIMAHYLLELYKNTTQSRFADDGYRFYEFIRDGILHTLEINHAVNFNWLFTMKIDGKTEYIYAGEKFKEIVLERYWKN